MAIESDDELARIAGLPHWSVPEQLTLEILDAYRDEPRIWLEIAINLMTLRGADAPHLSKTVADARQQLAARALFHAARRGLVSLLGSTEPGGDGSDPIPIPATYFDMPRNLGADNSIVAGPHLADEQLFGAILEKKDHRWFRVRVIGLAPWLESLLPGRATVVTGQPSTPPILRAAGRLK